MAEKTLIAKLLEDCERPGMLIISSPVVGYADGAPKRGLFLNPFDRIIELKILNQRYVLRLPRETHGRITEVFIPNSFAPVAFGTPIARIDTRAMSEVAESGAGGDASAGETAGEESGLISVKAPSEGIFYSKPAPDSPPFVVEGSEISSGSVLGLVEVMKCFNQITYGGIGLPESGSVVKILVEDSSEVSFGQTLFLIKPM
ncbi:MAG TPA: biotin/lipoyl-containing protein [Acidobacteriota bacterium]|nr:biotin/lipoyl-containing protein [Acidobacteriota bacterium]